MKPWPHQERAIASTRDAIQRGARAPLIVCPTGGGKTRIGVSICAGALARGNRVLWLAHRRELVEQAAADLRRSGATGLGFIQAGHPADSTQPIQVASIQTMLARSRGCAALMPCATVVVLDEAHHYVADEWQAIAGHYAHAIRVGLTATPQRADGTSLGNLFDTLINVASIRELTDAGFLVPCTVVRPDAKQSARTIAQDPLSAYREYAAGTQAIVFTADVEEARASAARFMSMGISAACVDGKMSPLERHRRIAGFKSGAIRVITNCFVLTEGFDHPAVETCILARGCGVLGTYLQIVGRVLRAAPCKSRALLLDLVGAVHTHGLPDDDREWTLDGNGCKKSDAAPVSQCRRCGAAFRPPAHCPLCGVLGRTDPRPIHISGDRLSPVERGALSSDVEKQSYYEWLLRERDARGYKPGWIHHRFVARFGVPYDGPRLRAAGKEGSV